MQLLYGSIWRDGEIKSDANILGQIPCLAECSSVLRASEELPLFLPDVWPQDLDRVVQEAFIRRIHEDEGRDLIPASSVVVPLGSLAEFNRGMPDLAEREALALPFNFCHRRSSPRCTGRRLMIRDNRADVAAFPAE